jgi:hypothetical protein
MLTNHTIPGAHTPAIVDAYKEAVCGLIAGRIRILEYRVNGKYVRGYLQQPDGTAWKTIGRSHRRFAWPWRRTEDRVLQNVAAGDRPLEPADDPRNPDGQH